VAGDDVILFDEPLSNVDAKVREELRVELLAMQKKIGFAGVYVTHDQEEAMAISDLIVVMHEGRVLQVGTPQEIYRRPASRFVASFIGVANVWDPADAIAGAARLLRANGAPADYRRALYAYNPSDAYIEAVVARTGDCLMESQLAEIFEGVFRAHQRAASKIGATGSITIRGLGTRERDRGAVGQLCSKRRWRVVASAMGKKGTLAPAVVPIGLPQDYGRSDATRRSRAPELATVGIRRAADCIPLGVKAFDIVPRVVSVFDPVDEIEIPGRNDTLLGEPFEIDHPAPEVPAE